MSNCICCCWPYECGCTDVEFSINPPDGYPNPPRNVLCPNCHVRVDLVYKKTNEYFNCCFIPCICCPTQSNLPYLGCTNCSHKFNVTSFVKCDRCHASATIGERHCSNCGRRIRN